MAYKKILPACGLLIFLFACSSNPQTEPTQVPTLAPASPKPTAIQPTSDPNSIPEPEIISPTPTPTVELSGDGEEGDSTSSEQPPQVDLGLPEYGVIATFHWLGLNTPTDITYNYEGWFNVLPDGSLQTVDETKGYASGDAGMNMNNECIEAVPADIQYDFTISGRRTDVPLSDVDAGVLMKYPDLVAGDDFGMFEFIFESPEITKIDIPPFVNCMPDADQEFINSLGTYWINLIPVIPPEYRTVPADEGYSCPGILSFNDEGLGSLEPCYNIFRP
jgi:hypothetical protein